MLLCKKNTATFYNTNHGSQIHPAATRPSQAILGASAPAAVDGRHPPQRILGVPRASVSFIYMHMFVYSNMLDTHCFFINSLVYKQWSIMFTFFSFVCAQAIFTFVI